MKSITVNEPQSCDRPMHSGSICLNETNDVSTPENSWLAKVN